MPTRGQGPRPDNGILNHEIEAGRRMGKLLAYIACGISGATQHQVGMKDSKFIIAINKDEEAPIFQLADLGIVGDTLSVIPKINENI